MPPPADRVDPRHVPSAAQIMGWIEEIVSQGIRRPGYVADRWTEDWAAGHFGSFGLHDVALEVVDVPMWEPLGPARLEAWPSDDRGATFGAEGLALPHSRSAPDGVEAELVRLDVGGAPGAAGKLALSEVALMRSPVAPLARQATSTYDPDGDFDHEVQVLPFSASFQHVMEPAMAAGAAGFVGALTGVPWETSDYYVPYDAVERPIPGLWVSPSAGGRLVSMLEAGPVTARLTTSARRTRATTHNVVGTLPGRSDDWVIVASHHDAPWASAVEDGSGIALVLAQARYWSQVEEDERPHNMLFLLTSGHMAGGAGSHAFVAQHADLLERTVVEIHLEHAARRCEPVEGRLVPTEDPEPRWWFTTPHPALETSVREAIEAEDLRRSLVLPPEVFFPNPPTDGSAFYLAGVPIVHFLTAPMYLFDAQDTVDKIHVDTLAPLTAAVARIVLATAGMTAGSYRGDVEEALAI